MFAATAFAERILRRQSRHARAPVVAHSSCKRVTRAKKRMRMHVRSEMVMPTKSSNADNPRWRCSSARLSASGQHESRFGPFHRSFKHFITSYNFLMIKFNAINSLNKASYKR